MVKLAEARVLRLRLPVPESLASSVHVGDTAIIHVQALGRTFSGKIARTTASLDVSTRTMQVEIDVPNADGELTPGMYADVSLKIRRSGDTLAVPVGAVDQTGVHPFVMLVNKSNKIEKRPVQVGISTAVRTEILSGLSDGDKVVVANLATFHPGETVVSKLSVIGNLSLPGEDQ